MCYYAEGDLDQAIDAYNKSLEIQPDLPDAHNNLGAALQAVGRHDEAMAHFETALRSRPLFAIAHVNRALMWLRNGDYERGWFEFEWRREVLADAIDSRKRCLMNSSNGNNGKPIRQVCVLASGMRVHFTLKKRTRDPCFLVCFRGMDGKRKEKSTRESTKRRATDAAIAIVEEDYTPKHEPIKNPSWDDAIKEMKRYMAANNLRPRTIDQYGVPIQGLRNAFPDTNGPAEVTPKMAQEFKVLRLEAGRAARTVKGDICNLKTVYGHWWRDTCQIVDTNPFEHVTPPKDEKKPPRVISDEEAESFLNWLEGRWDGWLFPRTFLETKKMTGCRIGELASVRTKNLRDGRLHFLAMTRQKAGSRGQ